MYKRYFKRCLDLVLALVLLVISFPVIFVSGIAIKCCDNGKILFKQCRVGLNGKGFYIYKLRTMARDKNGVNRVTKIGKFLRATSIDELPQLLNIIKGDMSFIGPRPWIEEYSRYFNSNDKKRWKVLPGVSGWAQVNGRNGMSITKKIQYDVWYVENVSFKLDVVIFLKTIHEVFKRTGASITEGGIQDELNELKERYEENFEIEVKELDVKIG